MVASANLLVTIRGRDQGASGVLGNLSASVRGLAGAVTSPIGAFGSLISTIGGGLATFGLAVNGLQAIGDAARGLSGAIGLGLSGELEDTRATMLAFTKDVGKTDKLLADLRSEADRTPFTFPELAKAASTLIPSAKAAGKEIFELIRPAELLAAVNPAEGLEGAAFALREALSGDWVSLQERFNLSRESINRLRKEGKPALEVVAGALAEMGIDMSLVANRSQTMSGRLSTLSDTWDGLRLAFSQPLFDVLKEGIIGLQGTLDDNKDSLTNFAKLAGAGLGQLATTVIKSLPAVVDLAGKLVELGQSIAKAFSPEIRNGPALVAEALRRLFGIDVSGLVGPLNAFIDVLRRIPGLISFGGDAISTFIGGLTGDWGGQTSDQIDPIHKAFGIFGQFLGGTVIPNVQRFVGFVIGTVIPALQSFGGFILTTVIPAVQQFSGWFQANALPAIQEFAKFITDTVVPAVLSFGKWLATDGLSAAQTFIGFFQRDVIPVLQNLWGLVTDIGGVFKNLLGPSLLAAGENAGKFFTGINPLISSLRDLATTLQPLAGLIGLVFGGLVAILPSVATTMKGFVDVLTGTLQLMGSAIGGLATALQKLFTGDLLGAQKALTDGFNNMAAASAKINMGIGGLGAGQAQALESFVQNISSRLGIAPNGIAPTGSAFGTGIPATQVQAQTPAEIQAMRLQFQGLATDMAAMRLRMQELSGSVATVPATMRTWQAQTLAI